MATTFNVFFLGTTVQIDTVEGNLTSENHTALQNMTFGSSTDPIATHLQKFAPGSTGFAGGSNSTAYDVDDSETFTLDGGAEQTVDAAMVYNNTVIRYTDGTTATVSAIVMQDTNGNTYLLPSPGTTATTYTNALMAKPIQSVTLGTASPSAGTNVYGMTADRYVMNLKDYIVEGTSGNDVIGSAYTSDPEGDRVDNSDGIDGSNNDTISAGAGDDIVSAGSGNDSVYGGTGNDTLFGGIGDDTLMGDEGNDSLDGGDGNDRLFGGLGNDTASGGAGNDLIYGGDGNDSLSGGDGNDTIYGDAGDDTLTGDAGNDVLDGGAGNDRLYGGTGSDTMSGGDGDDVFYLGNGTAGDTDSIVGGEAGESIGDAIDGSLATGGMTVTFTGNEAGTATTAAGNATFSQIENVYGGVGADSINASASTTAHLFDTGAGNDTVIGGSGAETIYGGAGSDSISAGAGNDSVFGGTGNDSISGGDGNDYLDGGEGNDTLDGGAGSDTLYGGAGNDVLYGGADADIIYAGAGDSVDGGESTTAGGVDNDILIVESGSVITYGGGNDESGIITLASGGTLKFSNIEHVTYAGPVDGTNASDVIGAGYVDVNGDQIDGTDGLNDVVYGYGGNDNISSGSGNDTVYGGTGNDTIYGGAGNDVLYGDAGNDSIFGGDGADSIYATEGNNTVDGGLGNDAIYGGLGNDSILGGEGDDSLSDTGGNNYADMGAGNDRVSTGAGNDTILGGTGNDTLYSGAGNDVLDGGAGNDFLYGGDGNDTLTGGDGSDYLDGGDADDLIFGGAGDTVDGGAGYDTLDLSVYRHSGTQIIYDPTNPQNGTVQFLDSSGAVTGTLGFTNIEHVIACFTPGTMISTRGGELRVEDLAVGDLVLTRDNGYQPIQWLGRRDLSADELRATPKYNPIRIAAGALGQGLPRQDMLVSPQHRVLVANARAELLFAEHEVLVAAKHLTDLQGIDRITPQGVSYIHFMFENHEIVLSDGAWTESFQPGLGSLAGLLDAQRDEILELFPALRQGEDYPAARTTLRAREARVLVAA